VFRVPPRGKVVARRKKKIEKGWRRSEIVLSKECGTELNNYGTFVEKKVGGGGGKGHYGGGVETLLTKQGKDVVDLE